MGKGRKIVFVLGLVGRVPVSIIVAKYNIFPRVTMAARAEKKKFWQSDLLTPSASTVEITYTEFVCEAILGYFVLLARNCLAWTLDYIVMQMRKTDCDCLCLKWSRNVNKLHA